MEDRPETSHTLNDDFKTFIDVQTIFIPDIPTYIPYGILGICRSGSAVIRVYLQEFNLIKDNLVVVLPGQVAVLKSKSEDFMINYFLLSENIINETLSGISRLSPLFFIHLRQKCLYNLTDDEVYRYTEYYNLIYNRLLSCNHSFQQEYIINVLRLFYLDLYNNYNNLLSTTAALEKRKEQLAYNFFLLILEHYKEQTEVAFYAEKLFITPKYLSAIIKEVSGRSAKDWITEYLLLELKSLLRNSSMNIQEITLKTNFSNQASLGRFFRKHTGMSPTEYRMYDKDKR